MSELLFTEGHPGSGTRRELGDGATIGREGCDVVLDDPEISRRHAIVRVAGVAGAIEDLGSRNGTFVNSERIDGVRELTPGDEVRLGTTRWRFEGLSGAPETVVRPQADATRAPAEPPSVPEPEMPAPPPREEPSRSAPPAPAAPSRPREEPQPAPVSRAPELPPEAASVVGRGESRGDVPPPPDPSASAVHAAPAPRAGAGGMPAFASEAAATPRGGSAARSGKATAIAMGIVLADAIALVVYFAAR